MSGVPGYLLLEDGRRFDGLLSGAVPAELPADNAAPGIGEVVFQTGMTGYQEVITDPSYRGQIVTFTSSHIGNTGMNRYDNEAPTPALAGIVVRELTERPSSWRSEETLAGYLERHAVPCLSDVDTRSLTRHIRESGALRGLLVPTSMDPEVALARVRAFPGLIGRDLVREVAPPDSMPGFEEGPVHRAESDDTEADGRAAEARRDAAEARRDAAEVAGDFADEFPFAGWTRSSTSETKSLVAAGKRITLVHCGMKEGIDQCLRRRGARVRIVTPVASVDELLAGSPDGILVSNGPGDPDALEGLIRTLRGLIGKVPLFGICLGHQVLALALGARTYKMKFGHHGINHPVRDLETGAVLVTSQNHGFAVDRDTLEVKLGGDVTGTPKVTHESLNDGVLEGFAVPELDLRAVQFHPEAQAGPHDARYLFAQTAEWSGSPERRT